MKGFLLESFQTSLTTQLFIEVPVPSQENSHVYVVSGENTTVNHLWTLTFVMFVNCCLLVT
jgi:hypothetical protein